MSCVRTTNRQTKLLMKQYPLGKGLLKLTMSTSWSPFRNIVGAAKCTKGLKSRDYRPGGSSSCRRLGTLSVCCVDLPHVKTTSYLVIPPNSYQNARLPILEMMSLPSSRMTNCTIHSTMDQEQLSRKIFQNREISHPSAPRRVESLSSGQSDLSSLIIIAFGLSGPAICYKDNQGNDYQAAPSFGNERSYLWICTGTGNNDSRSLMKGSLPCSNSMALILHLRHGKDSSTTHNSIHRPASERRDYITLKVAASGWHSYPELFESCLLYPPWNIWSELGVMAYSGDSAASSPDPLLELEADIRVLRRRVRRQGEFMQQMDVQGGRRLDRMDEEMGSTRAEFAAALEALENKVAAAIENMDLRLKNMEEALARLRADGNPEPGKHQADGNPSSRAKQR